MAPETVKTVTRGEQMLALRKRRMAATQPFLRGGFRPFFFGAAMWGIIALALWLCSLAGRFRSCRHGSIRWLGIAMKCCSVSWCGIAGFLLAAIPNWTGRLPIAGKPLLALFGLWLTARIALLFSGTIGLIRRPCSTSAFLQRLLRSARAKCSPRKAATFRSLQWHC